MYLIEFFILILFFYVSVVLEKQEELSPKLVNIFSVIFCIVAMTGLVGIEIANDIATFFPLALMLIPTLFIFRYKTYRLLMTLLEAVFIIAEITQKSQDVWRINVYTSLVALFFYSIIAFSTSRKRVNDAKEMDRQWRKSAHNIYDLDGTRGTLNKEVTDYLMNKQSKTLCAICTIDIVKFSNVNVKFGRDYGDQVLATIGRILKYAFRVGDVVGRAGGDEFTVFLKEISSVEKLQEKKREIKEKLEEITYPDGQKLQCRIQISVYEKEYEIEQ